MSKIIPIIMLTLSVLCSIVAACGLIIACAALSSRELFLVSVPFAVAALSFSILNGGIAAFLYKSRICRAAAAVSALAFLLALVAIIIWRVAG